MLVFQGCLDGVVVRDEDGKTLGRSHQQGRSRP
jgi:hypothetical protein